MLVFMPAALLMVGLSIASDYFVARRLTDDAYDQAIAGVAQGLAMTLESDRDDDLEVHFHAMMRTLQRIDAPDTWRYLVTGPSGHVIDGDPALLRAMDPGGTANPSFRTLSLGAVPERVATFRLGAGQGSEAAIVVVAETLHRRRSATSAIVGATMWPNAALMTLAIAMLLVGGRLALRPLHRLGERIEVQSADELGELPLAGTPRETLPLLQAFNHLIDRLRQASKTQQAFLNQTAHQLRTPLAALRTRLELLREAPPDEIRARCAAVESQVARLSHLTAQLLMLGRTEAAALERTAVDMPALIAELAPAFDDLAHAHGVQLAFELAPLQVDGVDWMLREALANLVDNAIAHAPADSVVTLRCGTGANDRGQVEVEDQGEGVAPDLRDRVFEPFVRVCEGRRPGTGLGLAIVRSIVARHGATVALATGADGQGTVARIQFP